MGRHVLRLHIYGYSVCLCPIKRTPGLFGLNLCTSPVTPGHIAKILRKDKSTQLTLGDFFLPVNV